MTRRMIRVPEYLRQFFGDSAPEQVEVTIIDDEFLEEEAKRAAGEAAEAGQSRIRPRKPAVARPLETPPCRSRR